MRIRSRFTASLAALLLAAGGRAWGAAFAETPLEAVRLPTAATAGAGAAVLTPVQGLASVLAAPISASALSRVPAPSLFARRTPAAAQAAPAAAPLAPSAQLVRLVRPEPGAAGPRAETGHLFDGGAGRSSDGTVLVTGFEAFGGFGGNAAGDAAKELHGARLEVYAHPGAAAPSATYRVVSRVLPVSYERSANAIAEAIERVRPAAVLMLGMSGRTPTLEVEKIARNSMNQPGFPDSDGRVYEGAPVNPAGPEARETAIPVDELVAALMRAGFPATASTDAGGYVCNSMYYCALQAAAKAGLKISPLFIHMPPAAEHMTLSEREAIPHWPLASLHEAAGWAASWLAAHAAARPA